MQKQQLEHFKALFNTILVTKALDADSLDMDKHSAPKGDEIDLAARDREQALDLKLKGRENFFIKKIEASLTKIDNGTFGTCEECDCEISVSRLMARPTATLCITCKEEEENGEKHIPYQKKSHTLGKKLGTNNVIHVQFGEDGNNGKQMNRASIPQ